MTSGRITIALGVIALALTATTTARADRAGPCQQQVFVNGRCVPSSMLRRLESMYRTKSQPGRYWYDKRSGLLGYEGQPAFGQLEPNLPFGAKLRRDASRGNTGVLINGRELHRSEVAFLRRYGPVVPGNYWMDAAANIGFVGTDRPFANLAALMKNSQAQARRGGQGGNTFRGNWLTGTYSGSSGGCSYVSTGSGSVMTGNCD